MSITLEEVCQWPYDVDRDGIWVQVPPDRVDQLRIALLMLGAEYVSKTRHVEMEFPLRPGPGEYRGGAVLMSFKRGGVIHTSLRRTLFREWWERSDHIK